MGAKIIVNHSALETRIALIENNQVAELFIERQREKGMVGNIYKGVVTKILPGMQAAFVDIGLKKAGFLYVGDIYIADDGDAYSQEMEEAEGALDRELEGAHDENAYADNHAARPRRLLPRYPIEDLLQEGQDLLVQVSKDPIGTKGCRLTSYISLPGRYLVYMPTVDHVGISRRIEDEDERLRLRELILEMKPPNAGYIVRTVSDGKNQNEFSSDMVFLTRIWDTLQETSDRADAPALVHQDLDLVARAVRDLLGPDLECMIIDDYAEFERCTAFVRSYLPHLEPKIDIYTESVPIFDEFGVDVAIERALGRKVWLKSGGYISIDQTEALVAVDVNTGRYVGTRNPEETILKTNLEAVNEIVYQLRLRNIGGIIIIDFIDMEREESKERIFHTLEHALKNDRSRTTILKVSELGLVEMTRQRVRESLTRTLCQPCSYCEGHGVVKSASTICYEVFRELARRDKPGYEYQKVLVNVHPAVAHQMLEEEAGHFEQLENELQKDIVVKADYDLHQEQFEVVYV